MYHHTLRWLRHVSGYVPHTNSADLYLDFEFKLDDLNQTDFKKFSESEFAE